MVARNRNDGLRKLCGCARRSWPKCEHPWFFNFKWAGAVYQFSLERVVRRVVKDAKGNWKRDRTTLGDVIDSKTAAEKERDRLRTAIREGTLQGGTEAKAQRETLTLTALFAAYRKQYLAVHRAGTIKNLDYIIGAITRTALERADGEKRTFGEWLATDITTDVIELYRRTRPAGSTGMNRHLELLRSLFNWASSSRRRLVVDNPFLDGSRAAVKLVPEHARRRRLQPGEGERLLAAAGGHLRAVIEAGLETGCRRGELLSLQWWQVRLEPKAEIFLPAVKTKTKADRTIPISVRLGAILDMRRTEIHQALDLKDDQDVPGTTYVFGNEIGEPVADFKRAWERAVLKAHGHRPTYRVRVVGEGQEARKVHTAALTAESRAVLRAIDLNFHDLRREAGSRWLDSAVPLHRIQKWLGHSNIAQTSTYLMANSADDDEAMRRFDAQRGLQRITTDSETGGIQPPQSATIEDSREQESSVKH